MIERPQWQVDTQTAQRECRETLDKWQVQISELRHRLEQSDEFTPKALRESVMEGIMPGLRQASIVAVAHVLLYLQILNGDMRWHADN